MYKFGDAEFLREIRLCLNQWSFYGDFDQIVPKELTHDFLLDNFKICNEIEEYYFLPCSDMFTDDDYQRLKSIGFIGNQKTSLKPYPFCFNGAYIQRKQLYYRIQHLANKAENYKGKLLETFSDLFPYFEDYKDGFKLGFESFEDDCIKKFLPLFADKNDYTHKIFEYVTKHVAFIHSWKNNHGGFNISRKINDNHNSPGEIIESFEDGKHQGYFYKAWSIILSNSSLFELKFKELMQPTSTKPLLIEELLNAIHTMQQNKIFWKADEDTKTRQILDLLSSKYHTKDQAKYGKSQTGKNAGSVDGVIKIDNKDFFLEAFHLGKTINRKKIREHIKKLELNYDSRGLEEKFILVYYNLPINKFGDCINKYINYIKTENVFNYQLDIIENIEIQYTDSRLYKSYHKREEKNVTIYHILIKFPE